VVSVDIIQRAVLIHQLQLRSNSRLEIKFVVSANRQSMTTVYLNGVQSNPLCLVLIL